MMAFRASVTVMVITSFFGLATGVSGFPSSGFGCAVYNQSLRVRRGGVRHGSEVAGDGAARGEPSGETGGRGGGGEAAPELMPTELQARSPTIPIRFRPRGGSELRVLSMAEYVLTSRAS